MNRLKERRKQYGLTQQEAADLLGISSRGYQNYEQGKRKPPLETALKMMQLFNCRMDEIIERDQQTEGEKYFRYVKGSGLEYLARSKDIDIGDTDKINDFIDNLPIEIYARDEKEANRELYVKNVQEFRSVCKKIEKKLNSQCITEAIHLLELLEKIPEYSKPDPD